MLSSTGIKTGHQNWAQHSNTKQDKLPHFFPFLNTFFARALNFAGAFFCGGACIFAKNSFGTRDERGAESGTPDTEDDEEDGKAAGMEEAHFAGTTGTCTPSALSCNRQILHYVSAQVRAWPNEHEVGVGMV